MLRCFRIILKVKPENILTTGQYMNYQAFSKLQFKPLPKTSFHSNHIDLRDTSGEKYPLSLPVSFVLFRCLKPLPTCISNLKDVTRWLLQDQWRLNSIVVLVNNSGASSVHLHKLLREPQFQSCVNISSRLQNAWVLTCWILLCQNLHKLLLVKKFQDSFKKCGKSDSENLIDYW